ncbi:hypothetical protein ACSBR2_009049 [Camellia fascicularis]
MECDIDLEAWERCGQEQPSSYLLAKKHSSSHQNVKKGTTDHGSKLWYRVTEKIRLHRMDQQVNQQENQQAHHQVLNKQDGGWIPVVKQRGRHTNQVGLKEESMDPRSMYALFLKFGVVKDVFIPQKRRKTTNTRFGFVRFNCPVAASVAEEKANGIWVDDKALIVHSAVYGKEKG